MSRFLAIYDDEKGNRQCWIYTNYSEFFSDTFNPDCKKIFLMELKVSGKNYAERKADLESKAIDYSNFMSEIYPISWGEIAEIENFFATNGKRYGLLTVFHKNCIC